MLILKNELLGRIILYDRLPGHATAAEHVLETQAQAISLTLLGCWERGTRDKIRVRIQGEQEDEHVTGMFMFCCAADSGCAVF